LIAPTLLRSVRSEIQEHLSFTEKETDIYKIFQSGDLANLDGLDDASLARLPSLLELRDALYSEDFRGYLSSLTGSGKLSGRKTDMAINVYTEGCHLLCHDDVIGSRRLSYILYLTDPDTPWQAEWGGALRLYPTRTVKDENGEDVKIPSPDHTLSIPPAFNQLSFFTVQPGQSFHDVEEVYHPSEHDKAKQKRVRMAISGWYHIPQEGEDGYEPGLEEKLAERSSLSQLQGRGDSYDQPQPHPVDWEAGLASDKDKGKGKQTVKVADGDLTESDLDFLLQFIAPSYLTPDIAEELSETFASDSSLSLERILSDKFAARVRDYIEQQEKTTLPSSSDDIESTTDWKVARPPHKHRFVFQQCQHLSGRESASNSPIGKLLLEFLPSQPFRKWLSLITGLDQLTSYNMLARRFRRGQDYTLANGYEGEEPRLEFTLGLTPTSGWEREADAEQDEDEQVAPATGDSTQEDSQEGPSVGGYEIYMAGDDEEEEDGDDACADESRPKPRQPQSDPAIYKAAHGEDDGILFSMAAGWNRMSIVLRDSGTLKFVKYVSTAAPGDRWDITGEIGVVFDEDEDEDDDGSDEEE
jgi:Rps23 Pro-64 3,4-dihydroxylase Tpa1-like proline 4-hydroxylase